MRKNVCLLLCCIAIAITPIASVSAQGWETKKGDAYALGVSLGFASFHASIASAEKKYSERMEASMSLAMQSIIGAKKFAGSINTNQNVLDISILKSWPDYAQNWREEGVNQRVVPQFYNDVVTARESYTAVLAKTSAGLTDAYTLGVNISIAEGEATVGEDARQIVYISLTNAKTAAQALKLSLGPLDECIILASGKTPMPDVYAKIVSLRSTYQASF